MARHSSLHDEIAKVQQARTSEQSWVVWLDEPLERVFCEERERLAVMVALLSNTGVWCECKSTDTPGVVCIECEAPMSVVSLKEQFMSDFIPVLRRNGVHGHYHKRDDDRRYEF